MFVNLAINIYALPKNSTSGKNISTKIINISVHSNGHPNRKIIICVITKNCHGARSIDLKKCSNTCDHLDMRILKKSQDPMNNHIM